MAEMNSNTENNVVDRKGMVLPFEPLSLAFDHMNYYVDMPAVSQETNKIKGLICGCRFI